MGKDHREMRALLAVATMMGSGAGCTHRVGAHDGLVQAVVRLQEPGVVLLDQQPAPPPPPWPSADIQGMLRSAGNKCRGNERRPFHDLEALCSKWQDLRRDRHGTETQQRRALMYVHVRPVKPLTVGFAALNATRVAAPVVLIGPQSILPLGVQPSPRLLQVKNDVS